MRPGFLQVFAVSLVRHLDAEGQSIGKKSGTPVSVGRGATVRYYGTSLPGGMSGLLAFPITPCPTPSPPCYLATRRPHIAASARNSMPPPAADRQRSARHRHVGFPLRTGRGDPACYPCAGGSPRPHFGAAGMAGPGTWPWSGSLICRIRTRAQHPPHPFGGRAHVRFAHFGRMARGGGEGPSPHDVA